MHKEVERSKEKEKIFNAERVDVPQYASIPIKLASSNSIERQPFTIQSKLYKVRLIER